MSRKRLLPSEWKPSSFVLCGLVEWVWNLCSLKTGKGRDCSVSSAALLSAAGPEPIRESNLNLQPIVGRRPNADADTAAQPQLQTVSARSSPLADLDKPRPDRQPPPSPVRTRLFSLKAIQ